MTRREASPSLSLTFIISSTILPRQDKAQDKKTHQDKTRQNYKDKDTKTKKRLMKKTQKWESTTKML
jgi:hypothetical protein